MSDAFLSEVEIREIAKPLVQPAAIVRWFRSNGFNVKVRPNGMPLVSRAHYEQVTSGGAPAPAATGEQPDVGAYLQRIAAKSKRKTPAGVV